MLGSSFVLRREPRLRYYVARNKRPEIVNRDLGSPFKNIIKGVNIVYRSESTL